MRVLVHHGGQQWGPFNQEELQRALAEGRFQPGDLAWHEGQPAWVPLSSIIGTATAAGSPEVPMTSPTSGMAVASLALGAASTFFCILTGIPAIICGHIARAEIRRSGGRLAGDGLAVAGLVLGYLSVVLLIPVAMFFLVFVGSIGMSASNVPPAVLERLAEPQYPINAAMQVYRACKAYATDNGGRFPETLEELVPFYLPDRELLVSPLLPEEEVGYFYYGGVETDSPSDPLLISKGDDEFGRKIVIHKNGLHTLRREQGGDRVIARANSRISAATAQSGSAR